jgi:chromosome segregation ATPase
VSLDTILAELRALRTETRDGFGRLSILETAYRDMVPQLESIKDRLEAIEHRMVNVERRGDFFSTALIDGRTRDASEQRSTRAEIEALAARLTAVEARLAAKGDAP